MKLFVLFAFALSILIGCDKKEEGSPEPERSKADFSIDYYHLDTLGIPFSFTNLSTGAVAYEWHFGDGETSAFIEPQHFYDAPGTYTINLTAISVEGVLSSKTATITVGEHYLKKFILSSITNNTGSIQDTFQFHQYFLTSNILLGSSLFGSAQFQLENFSPIENTYDYDFDSKGSLWDLSHKRIYIGSKSNSSVLSTNCFEIIEGLNLTQQESLNHNNIALQLNMSCSHTSGYITTITGDFEFSLR